MMKKGSEQMAFEFVSTQAMQEFKDKGSQYVKDFSEIKKDFEEYNSNFLAEFEGLGAEKYRTVSQLITEKVSDFEEMYKSICEELINPTLENFKDLDKYLDEQNIAMKPEEKNQDGDDD